MTLPVRNRLWITSWRNVRGWLPNRSAVDRGILSEARSVSPSEHLGVSQRKVSALHRKGCRGAGRVRWGRGGAPGSTLRGFRHAG